MQLTNTAIGAWKISSSSPLPSDIYWRTTPDGVGYIDNCLAGFYRGGRYPYVFQKTRPEYDQYYGRTFGTNPPNDIIAGEWSEKTYEQYQLDLANKSTRNIYVNFAWLMDVPFVDIDTQEPTSYVAEIGYMIENNGNDRLGLRLSLNFYNGNTKQFSQSYDGAYALTPSSARGVELENVHYYVCAGVGRYWGDKYGNTTIDNALYVKCIACATREGDLGMFMSTYAYDYAYIRDTFNIMIPEPYFTGNNDNPDYPPKT